MIRITRLVVVLFFVFFSPGLFAFGQDGKGMYFHKKSYTPNPLPVLSETRSRLPQPIYDEDPVFVDAYWSAWEIAFENMYEPSPGSGFVSQFIDAAFNDCIFLWDMSFITMFARYGTPHVPAISGLDNFYVKQHPDGEICREIYRESGEDKHLWINHTDEPLFSRYGIEWRGLKMPVIYRGREIPKPNPRLTLEGMNHPILAWAELESFMLTADTNRIALVYPPLTAYFQALKKYIRQGNGLYMTDWASMDNSARNTYIMYGGTTVDISSEMTLFARNLSEMAMILGKTKEASSYQKEADELSVLINEKMWNSEDEFYYDLTLMELHIPSKTIAGFWPLIAEVPDDEIAAALVRELNDTTTFNRKHRPPTLAATQEDYNPLGGYWNGSVWAPTTMMVVRGLEKFDYHELADEIAMNHLKNVIKVYKETGTLWENYAADAIQPGDHSRKDFVGWSGIAPIGFLLEYAIGIKANAPDRKMEWVIKSDQRIGVKQYWFGNTYVDLVCGAKDENGNRNLTITSTGKPFQLKIILDNKEIIREIVDGKEVKIEL